ncbi:hypothetical protein BC833DRAFT_584703 [Globomyces pollinis-pini]|nr:hypothetical protein BC833DRAFT_584703 [Globomyces pollinis-pini]
MKLSLIASTLAITASATDIGAQCTAINYQKYPLFFKLANGAIDVMEPLANEFADELITFLGEGTHKIPVGKDLDLEEGFTLNGFFNKYTLESFLLTDLKVNKFNVDLGEITTPKPQGLAGSVNIKDIAFEFSSTATVRKCFKYVFTSWCSTSTTTYSVASKFKNASGTGSATLALAKCPETLSWCSWNAFKKNFMTVWEMKFIDLLTYVYPNGAKIDELSIVLPDVLDLTFLTNHPGSLEAKVEQALENILAKAATRKPFRDLIQSLITKFGPRAANAVINKVLKTKFMGDCDGSLVKYNKDRPSGKLCNNIDLADQKTTQLACPF